MPKQTTESTAESRVTWNDLEACLRSKMREWLQALLEAEMDDLLGRRKSERRQTVDSTSGCRSGHGKPRRLTLRNETVTIRRPRVQGLAQRVASCLLPLFVRRTAIGHAIIPTCGHPQFPPPLSSQHGEGTMTALRTTCSILSAKIPGQEAPMLREALWKESQRLFAVERQSAGRWIWTSRRSVGACDTRRGRRISGRRGQRPSTSRVPTNSSTPSSMPTSRPSTPSGSHLGAPPRSSSDRLPPYRGWSCGPPPLWPGLADAGSDGPRNCSGSSGNGRDDPVQGRSLATQERSVCHARVDCWPCYAAP